MRSIENAPARPVEFRYADPPNAGFDRANAFPIATRLELVDKSCCRELQLGSLKTKSTLGKS
jgi:hypothetical protein